MERYQEFCSKGFEPIYFHATAGPGDRYMTGNMPEYLDIVKLLVRDFFGKAVEELPRRGGPR
jgi:hypothetical protein